MPRKNLPAIAPAHVQIGDIIVVDDYNKKGWTWLVTGFDESVGDGDVVYHMIRGLSLDKNEVCGIYATPKVDRFLPMSVAWRVIRNGKQIAGDAP